MGSGAVSELRQRAGQHALAGARAVLDQRKRGGRRATVLEQPRLQRGELAHAHVDRQGLALLRQRGPVQRVV